MQKKMHYQENMVNIRKKIRQFRNILENQKEKKEKQMQKMKKAKIKWGKQENSIL